MAKREPRLVFPTGAEYDAMPPGARQRTVLWKNASGHTHEVDLELAIEAEANMRLVDILKSGKLPAAQDFERCATKPPMSGARLLDLLHRVGAHAEQYAQKAANAQPRKMGAKGGRAQRKDLRASQKAAVLKAWSSRANKHETAKAWAERGYMARWFSVSARTAALWIRAAEPKKKRRQSAGN